MKVKLTKLKPNPINDEIYSPTDLTDLKNSLETNGLLEPIVCSQNYIIISGHRRYFALKQLKWKECDIRLIEVDNELVALIEFNRTRMKSVQDIINENRLLEQEFKKELGGQGTRTDKQNSKRFNTILEISNKLGVGTSQLKQIRSIYNYEPKLIEKIDSGKLSISGAYKIVQEKYMKRKERTDDDIQQSKLKKFLEREQPEIDVLIDTLQNTYPYSLLDISTKDVKELKKKD